MRALHASRQTGLTLIEMLIVVGIAAALGLVAMVGWRRYLASARKSEVASMFAEIRAREEAYRTEFSAYLSSGASEDDLWPQLGAGEPKAKAWEPAPDGWRTLGLRPSGPQLYCAYSVVAGDAGAAPAGARGRTVLPVAPTSPWWYAVAICDNDGDPAVNAVYLTASEHSTISDTDSQR